MRNKLSISDVHYCIADGVEFVELHNSQRAYPPHSHAASYTMGLVLSGRIKLETDKETFLYGTDDSFVLPPFVEHRIAAVERYDMLTVSLKIPLMEIEAFIKIAAELIPLYEACFTELYRQLPEQQRTAYSDMAQNLYNGEAVQYHGSKYHAIRAFKRAAGLPPGKFRIQSMVRRAQRLIASGVGLTEAAQDSGFYDQSHFIRHFKYFTGLTPSEYRKVSTKLG